MTENGLPTAWRVVSMGDESIARTASGGTPDRSKPEYFGGEIRWVKSGEMDDNWLFDTEEKLTPVGFQTSSAKIFPAGTLLVAMYGATAGKTAILGASSATNQAVCAVLAVNESFDSQFLQFQLIHIRPKLLSARSGGAQPNISQTVLKTLEITLPPLPEQRAIARVLRAVQAAREARQREATLERERKAALMDYLFTHGTRGEPTKQTPIGEMPESWEPSKLGKHCHKPDYGYTTSAVDEAVGPKFLRITDIQNDRVHWAGVPYCRASKSTTEKYRLERGDIVIARIGATTGKAYLINECPEAVFASYLIRVRTKADLLSDFVSYYLQTESYWHQIDQSKGGRLKGGVNIPILRDLDLPLPSVAEQRMIADTLRASDAKITALDREIALLDELFRSLLEELMSGRVAIQNDKES